MDSSVMSQPALRCKLVHLIMKPYVDENGDGRTKLARFRRRSPYCLKELLLLSFPSDVNTIRYPTDSPRYRTAIHRLPTISHGVYGISSTSDGILRYPTKFSTCLYPYICHGIPPTLHGNLRFPTVFARHSTTCHATPRDPTSRRYPMISQTLTTVSHDVYCISEALLGIKLSHGTPRCPTKLHDIPRYSTLFHSIPGYPAHLPRYPAVSHRFSRASHRLRTVPHGISHGI